MSRTSQLVYKLFFEASCFTFQSETGPNYYKEVPLSEILAVDSAKNHSGEEALALGI